MRKSVDTVVRQGVEKFGKAAGVVLNTIFSSIVGTSIGISVRSVARAEAGDIVQGFEKGVLVRANETESAKGAGLLFATGDITSLADMMLMGDGTAKPALDAESKDAINEMMNQFFGGLTAPVKEALDKLVHFKVAAVSVPSTAELTAESYICYDLAGTLKGKTVVFRLYIDNAIAEKLDGESAAQVTPLNFFGNSKEPTDLNGANMDMLLDIDIPLSVRMGTAKLFLKDILGLGPGNIVELDQNADDFVELTVNDKLIARGEVVIVDGYFGFRIKEIVSKAERLKKLKD